MQLDQTSVSCFPTYSMSEADLLGPLIDCSQESLFEPTTQLTPLAVNLHFPETATKDYPQLLTKELTLYTQKLSNHCKPQQQDNVAQSQEPLSTEKIWFRGSPLKTLSMGEITEVVFLTATNFMLDDTPHSEYGFECTLDEVNDSNLALMQGLRFTTLLLNIDTTHVPKTQRLWALLDLIHQYRFQELHFRLNIRQTDPTTLYHWLESLMVGKPQLIELDGINEMEDPILLDQLTHRMKCLGYSLIGDRFFIADNHHLLQLKVSEKLQYTPWGLSHPKFKAWIGLGIGALGKLGYGFYHNTKNPSKYQSMLDQDELPIQSSGKHVGDKATQTWQLIEQLICHHRIKNPKILHISKEHPTISQVFKQACSDGWMKEDGKYLSLSDQGLNHLHELCRNLNHY